MAQHRHHDAPGNSMMRAHMTCLCHSGLELFCFENVGQQRHGCRVNKHQAQTAANHGGLKLLQHVTCLTEQDMQTSHCYVLIAHSKHCSLSAAFLTVALRTTSLYQWVEWQQLPQAQSPYFIELVYCAQDH